MSTEFRPAPPSGWSASFTQKDKLSKSPPVALNTQSAGRGHFRSSSFGDFVSRLLLSRRQEKGHTLRSEFNDDGTQDAVGLVFNLQTSQSRKSSAEYQGFSAAIKRSWPRRESSDAMVVPHMPDSADEQPPRIRGQPEQPRRFSLGDMVGIARRARQSGGDETQRTSNTGDKKKVNALSRLIGSLKRTKGEQRREGRASGPSQSQIIQLLESKKSCPEVAKFSDEKEITKTQQIFEDKKYQGEQRRRLQESGDFLGVQGANPRTGYWDISDATSSSEPSQMSEHTKLKLNQQARELAEQKKKYEEAQKSHRAELMRLEALKESKKREKEEHKKMDSRMRQRRHGKWRASETGWSSVFEPELSPIQQSEAGTPVAELEPGDRLFPIPCAADPNPYVNDTPIKQRDYFGHRAVSSPLAHKRPTQGTDALSVTPRSISIPRKPVGLPGHQHPEGSSETVVHTHGHPSPPIPIQKSLSSKVQQQQYIFHTHSHPSPSIRVEESFPSKLQKQQSVFRAYGHRSSDSVQKSSTDKVQQQKSRLAIDPVFAATRKATIPPLSFLENEGRSAKPASSLERKATAISFQSASTKQVAVRPPLVQSLGAHRITSLNELPPVILKDPIAARIPLSCQTPKGFLATWVPPATIRTVPTRLPSFINTSITTTTGYAPLLLLPGQADGANDIRSDTPWRRQCLQNRINQIPPRTSSQRKNISRKTHKTAFQTHPTNITISSEHQLNLTKERSLKLYQNTSPRIDKAELKSTLISTSTRTQSLKKQEKMAQSAALLAFQQVRRQAAIKKTRDQNGGQLTPPKTRKQKGEDRKHTNTRGGYKLAWDENVDIGDPSKTKKEQGTGGSQAMKASPIIAARAAALKFAASDKLVVWHPEPSAEKGVGEMADAGETGAHMKALVLYQRRGVSSGKGLPTPGRRPQSIGKVVIGMAQGAWLVIEPVFDAHSSIRRRFEQRRLTWQDAGLFIAAAIFMFMTAIILARIVGLGLLVGKVLAVVFWLLFVF
ncbi:hypothetical protein N431DRAFT_497298 [Stipitochalara longipes BDJ]|nr:hypothetical protein N431DRAFT_497298 [Stipitochalara longipes BDJ]